MLTLATRPDELDEFDEPEKLKAPTKFGLNRKMRLELPGGMVADFTTSPELQSS